MRDRLRFRSTSFHINSHVRRSARNARDSAAFSIPACSRKLLTPPPPRGVVTGSAISQEKGEGGGSHKNATVGAVGVLEGSESGMDGGKQ
jgi:hypothetical protein